MMRIAVGAALAAALGLALGGCAAKRTAAASETFYAHEAHPGAVSTKPGPCAVCGAEMKPVEGDKVIYACPQGCEASYSLAPGTCPKCGAERLIHLRHRGP